MAKAFRRINSKDFELMQLQDAVTEAFGPLLTNPLNDFHIVKTQLATGVNEVSHGLGRPIQGYIVIRKDGPVEVYEPSQSSTPSKTFRLQAIAPVLVSLIVF